MEFSRAVVAPSVLSADFADISTGIDRIASSGAPWIHLDVMDGSFVPNISFGPKMVADIRSKTELFLDVHLMIQEPQRLADAFIDAGADAVTFHIEACTHAHRLMQHIQERGCKAGISIVPSTPVSAIETLLPDIDIALVMTVNPGFGGQALIPNMLKKVSALRAWRTEHRAGYRVSVDGGINAQTARGARESGADVMVSGSAFFESDDAASYVQRLTGSTLTA